MLVPVIHQNIAHPQYQWLGSLGGRERRR